MDSTPDYAAVNTTVDLCKKIGKNKCLIKVSGKSLINRIIFNLRLFFKNL